MQRLRSEMAQFLTENEISGVREIRKIMKNEIPEILDTDFNLGRWWRCYRGNLDNLIPKFRIYLANRKAAGFDRDDFMETFFDLPVIKKFSPYLAMSRISDCAINSKDNALIFVEGAITEPNKILKVFKTSDYVLMFLGFCEYFQTLILRHEKRTGKPSYGICLYDMAGSNLSDYANPLAPINKLLKARVLLWQDFYGELLKKVIIVNPPALLSAIWQVAQYLVHQQFHNKFVFVTKHADLLQHLDINCIPVGFGGNLKDSSGWAQSANCCNEKKRIEKADFYKNGHIWMELGLEPNLMEINLGPKQKISINKNLVEKSALLWQFWASGEVMFGITRVSTHGENLVFPNLKLFTTKLAEEGKLETLPGDYRINFENTSSIFNLKLRYCVELCL